MICCVSEFASDLVLSVLFFSLLKWPTGLVELATGRNESKLFQFGEDESSALLSLYSLLTPGQAIRFASKVIDSPSNFGDNTSKKPSNCWPNLILLVRRASENGLRRDSKASYLTSLHAALSGILASAFTSRCFSTLAVVLTLARCFTRISVKRADVSNVEYGARGFCLWLQQVLTTASRANIRMMCQVLSQLVPYEPLNYLRSIISTLRRKTELWDSIREYVTLSRKRMSDLEMQSRAPKGLTAAKTDCPQSVINVVNYVHEFSRKDGHLPARLVREMNFHRYYFRANVAETLLSPELLPPAELLRSKFPRGRLKEFNSYRISMIRLIAFERKDRIITCREATEAIANIEKGATSEEEGRKADEERDAAPIQNPVDLQGLLEELIRIEGQSTGGRELSKIDERLLSCLQEIQREPPDEFSSSVRTLLTLILSKIVPKMTLSGSSATGTEGSFTWLETFASRVLQNSNLKLVLAALHHQIVLLLCAQIDDISSRNLIRLAILVHSLDKSSKRSKLSHTAIKKRSIIGTIAADLQLDDGAKLEKTLYFVVYYLTAATSTIHDDLCVGEGQKMNCFAREELDGANEGPMEIPTMMIQLVRWLASCPYRLASDKGPSDALKLARAMLKTKLFADTELSIEWWVKLELRSKFGCARHTCSVLSKFLVRVESLPDLIATVAYHLAVNCCEGNLGNADWIRLALYQLARERPLGIALERSSRPSNLAMRNLELLVLHNEPSRAALYLETISSTSEKVLYVSAREGAVGRHIGDVVMPCVWPLTISAAKLLLPTLMATSLTMDTGQSKSKVISGNEPSSSAFTSSPRIAIESLLAAYWEEVRSQFDEIPRWVDRSHIISRAKEIWAVLKAIFNDSSEVQSESVSVMASLAARDAGIMGVALVSYIRKMFECERKKLCDYEGRLREMFKGLCNHASRNIGVIDMLDVVVDIACRIPLTAAVSISECSFDSCLKWSTVLLAQALDTRCALLSSFNTDVLEIATSTNKTRQVTLVRDSLGLHGNEREAKYSNATNVQHEEDEKENYFISDTKEQPETPGDCKQYLLWSRFAMLRIAVALGHISDEGLKTVFDRDSSILTRMIELYVSTTTADKKLEMGKITGLPITNVIPNMERDVEATIQRLLKFKRRVDVRICSTQASPLANVLRSRSPYLYAQIYQRTC